MSARVTYGRLNRQARETLRCYGHGVTIAGYVRHYDPDGVWRGDACGCPDDRCIGYHHDAGADCGCLEPLLWDYAAELAGRCAICGGTEGRHGMIHTRYGNGGGGNRPCPFTPKVGA